MGSTSPWPSQPLFRNVLIADDHRLVGQGIEKILDGMSHAIHLVASGEQLLKHVRQAPPDIVIADVNMPGISGIEAMEILKGEGCSTPFLFLTMYDEPTLATMALRAGARGYLPKTAAGEELIRALVEIARGGTYLAASLAARMVSMARFPQAELTPRQVRILKCVSKGQTSKEIAQQLGLSIRTVESHKYQMMQVFNVHSTLALLRRADAEGLLRE